MPLRHWLQLSLTPGIGSVLSRRLINSTGNVESACAASLNVLRTIDGIGRIKADQIRTALQHAAGEADAELGRANAIGVSILCPDDQTYPILLRSIPDPPNVLYMKGRLEPRDLNAVAIVGSRKCSHYGREQAERFGALLGGAGVTVISGGARGVDAAAHHGALTHPQGRTIAVLGCGIDVTYPAENASLFERIAERGAVLSEYALGTPPLSDNFPRRNRIVSGMSRGVLVIEADERSGALITARQACDDHGRPVFAMPGRVDNPLSAGPHQLLRDGAILAAKLEDILDNLGPLPQEALEPLVCGSSGHAAANEEAVASLFDRVAPPKTAGSEAVAVAEPGQTLDLSDRQRAILAALDTDATTIDSLIERTALSAQAVLQELTILSLRGKVRRIDGQTYARRG
jgi:DNA processing protein